MPPFLYKYSEKYFIEMMRDHIYNQSQFGENWFTYPRLYSEMVQNTPSGSKFVEVGSWKGKSTAYMTVEIINSGKDIQFFCVDIWEGSQIENNCGESPGLFDIFNSNMKPLEGHFTPLRMKSVDASLKFDDESLDFVFIDGSHQYEDVKNDIAAWMPKVKFGGIIAGHDYSCPDVQKAVMEQQLEIAVRGGEDCWFYIKK